MLIHSAVMEDSRQSSPTLPIVSPYPVAMHQTQIATRHQHNTVTIGLPPVCIKQSPPSSTSSPPTSIKQSPCSSVTSSPTSTDSNASSQITIEGKLENVHFPLDIPVPSSMYCNMYPMGYGCQPGPIASSILGLSKPRMMVKPTDSVTLRKTSSTSNSSKIEKRRTLYLNDQILLLERLFQDKPYPDHDTIEQLSRSFDRPEKAIKIWFQNRRARTRKNFPVANNASPEYNVPGLLPVPEASADPCPLNSKRVIRSEPTTHESDLENLHVSFPSRNNSPPTLTSDLDTSSDSITYHRVSPSLSPNDFERQRNSRTNYSNKQIKLLEQMYEDEQYPNNDSVDRLSGILGLLQKSIKIWFQNKRARSRKSKRTRKDTPRIQTSPVAPQIVSPNMPPHGIIPPTSMIPPSGIMLPYGMMPHAAMIPPAAMMMPQPNPYHPGYMPYPYPFMYPNC